MTIDINVLIAYLGGEEVIISTSKKERIERFLRKNFIVIPLDGVI